jgi:hypothetical protein
MKNCFRVVLSAVAVCVLSSSYALAEGGIAALQDVQGEVLLHKAQSAPDSWQPASSGASLESGDGLKTAAGTCTVVYTDQASFKVDANTVLVINEKPETQDISLTLGRLKAMVNKEKVIKPFQVVTPTAVGAVRGTIVDFGVMPGAGNQFSVNLTEGGPVQIYNDEASLDLNLEGKKKVDLKYDGEMLLISCDCQSDGPINFEVQGASYSADPCKSISIKVGPKTASAGLDPPSDDPGGNHGDETTPNENPNGGGDDVPPPSSPDGGNE